MNIIIDCFSVQLLNHRHEKIAVRTITFHALDRCFCVAYCRCRVSDLYVY